MGRRYVRAGGSSVEIREPDSSIMRDLVDIGGPNLTAKASHIRKSQVISNHD